MHWKKAVQLLFKLTHVSVFWQVNYFFFFKLSLIFYVIRLGTCYFLMLVKIQSDFWDISNQSYSI